MKAKLLYALLSSSVISAAAWGMSTAALDHMPVGGAQRIMEKYAIAPGRMLLERFEGDGTARRLRKESRKTIRKGKKELDKAADKLDDTLGRYELDGGGGLPLRAKRLTKFYNVGAWAVVGFVLSLLLTLILGVSSVKTALSLGVKVTLAMFFLQVALVFGGILAYQRFVQ